ncbi:MAG: hypothetical protein R2780_04530 [Crocinitomicaceae bacterium]|nr:hypothetical protein [Crocinitomicaceae bacterium]
MEILDQAQNNFQRDLKSMMRIGITGIFVYMGTSTISSVALQCSQDLLIADDISPQATFKSAHLIGFLIFVFTAFLMADWMKRHIIKRQNLLKKMMYLSILFFILMQVVVICYAALQDVLYTIDSLPKFYRYMDFTKSSAIAQIVPVIIPVLEMVILCLFMIREPKIVTKTDEIQN